MDLAPRTYVLQNGEVQPSGETAELRQREDVRESYLGL